MRIEIMNWESMLLRSTWWNPFFKYAQVGLRVLTIGFATASIATMLTSNQEIYMQYDSTYIPIANAQYSYSPSLRYKLIVDAVVCGFSLLSSILVYKRLKCFDTEPKTSLYFYLLIADAVMMVLTISACSAATSIGLVGLQGLEKPGISWAPICPTAKKFCFIITLSVASSYAAFACITALTIISACKLRLQAID